MSIQVQPELVHSPLARWAVERGAVVAIEDGKTALSFAQFVGADPNLSHRAD